VQAHATHATRQSVVERFKDGTACVEDALADIDASAVLPDQKVKAYKNQCKVLAQWITVQHKQWPELATDADALHATSQALARLETGTAALRDLQLKSPEMEDTSQARSSVTDSPSLPNADLARATYQTGFKAVSFLAVQTGGGKPVVDELVELLCLCADAFVTHTAGEPPCENELNELLKLRNALARCRLNFSSLTPAKTKALGAALQLLGLPPVGRKPVRIIMPTLYE
ncbi:MAG: hypothetical protein H7346_00255, partial [Burkholderiaceae bacterium]|nr:hypothetical protein [Burkholderiaceae bacterium]